MKKLILIALVGCNSTLFSQHQVTVYFDFDKHHLTSQASSTLDSLIAVQKQSNTTPSVNLHGYCDPIGSDGYNDRLSLRRVATVKSYLVGKGMPADHIVVEMGHGEKDQLNDNQTADERALNRRVQITFTEASSQKPDGSVTLKKQIGDSSISVGSNIVLKNINFYGGRHIFLPSSKPMLDELLDAMITYPNLVIRIEGHICCEATPNDGLDADTGEYKLSEERAKAIKQYLVDNYIDSKRITYKGFGHSAPIHPYPEKSEAEQIENRRVEIKIISK